MRAFNQAVVIGTSVLLAAGVVAKAAETVGSTVEVREGDTWSKVKVLGVEGTRTHIQYDDGTDEWVGRDRLRSASGIAPETPGEPTAPAGTPATPTNRFVQSEAVEFKRDSQWLPATVRQVTPTWIFVVTTGNRPESFWVEPWAVRVQGSAYDINSAGTRGRSAQPGELPPRQRMDGPPISAGNRFVASSGDDQQTVTAEDLRKTFDTVSFDQTHEPPHADAMQHVATTRPAPGEFAAWAIHNTQSLRSTVLTCGDSMKTAVVACSGFMGTWSTVVRANLRGHGQFDTRYLHISDLKFMSAGDEGDSLLTIFDWDRRLQYWKWDKTQYRLAANLQLEQGSRNGIVEALLVGPDRAVVQSSSGLVALVDLAKKQAISAVTGSSTSQFFMHPSRQLIGVMTANGTAMLLRTSDFAILGEYPNASGQGNVAVDPSGEYCAYPTTAGPVRVVKIADGSELGLISVGAAFNGRLDLADDKFLIVNGSTVYEVKSGLPVWIYQLRQNTMFTALPSGQFLLAEPGNGMTSMAIVTIPDQIGRAALKSASPDRFMLKPGTSIKIDGDFGAFGDDRQKASDAVATAVQTAGMTVSTKDEPFHLNISIAGGPTVKRDFAPDMSAGPFRIAQTLDVPSTILTATLNYNGQAVWTQEVRFAAGNFIHRDEKQSFQDVLNAAAKPNVGALKSLSIPSYLPVGAKPGTPAALGESVLRGPHFVPLKTIEPKAQH
ncbi:MAG: hypothetical protein ACTHLZ_01830 [Tepidisphaeraceae bacterium]